MNPGNQCQDVVFFDREREIERDIEREIERERAPKFPVERRCPLFVVFNLQVWII
jgi:hypothetical protein